MTGKLPAVRDVQGECETVYFGTDGQYCSWTHVANPSPCFTSLANHGPAINAGVPIRRQNICRWNLITTICHLHDKFDRGRFD